MLTKPETRNDTRTSLEHLCAHHHLGVITAPPRLLSGGYLHNVWRIESQKGTVVAKALNPAIMEKPGMFERLERSECIGAAFNQAGLPAVAAYSHNGRFTFEHQGRYLLLFPFIKGSLYDLKSISPHQACQVAGLLARMHNLHLPIQKEVKLHYDIVEESTWKELLAECRAQKLPFTKELEKHLPFMLRCNEEHFNNLQELNSHLVLGHRDLHPENILWENPHTPHIIDWEYAGLLNPIQEITGAALEWSGLINRTLDPDCFRAFINAYQVSGGELTMAPLKGFYTFVANNLLSWTEINITRVLGRLSSSAEERAFATQMLGEIFKTFAYIEEELPALTRLLDTPSS